MCCFGYVWVGNIRPSWGKDAITTWTETIFPIRVLVFEHSISAYSAFGTWVGGRQGSCDLTSKSEGRSCSAITQCWFCSTPQVWIWSHFHFASSPNKVWTIHATSLLSHGLNYPSCHDLIAHLHFGHFSYVVILPCDIDIFNHLKGNPDLTIFLFNYLKQIN